MNWRNRDDLERRLDQALDALNAEQAPLPPDEDDPELIDLVDTARLVRQLRDPAWPDEDFPAGLAAALADDLMLDDPTAGLHSDNGRLYVVRPRRLRMLLWAAAALVRTLGVAAIAGIVAGAIVGGFGGRIVMRISGYLYEREHPGSFAITESSGQPVGDITLAGTFSLLIEVTLFLGISGGLVYLLFQPWLPGRGWRRDLVVGLFFLLLLGSVTIASDNQDFRRLGSPLLNVVMFGTLIFGFGFFIGPINDWLNQRVPRSLPSLLRLHSRAGYIGVMAIGGLILLSLLLTMIGGIVAVASSQYGLIILPIFVGAVVTILLIRLLASTTGATFAMQFGDRSAALARWIAERRVATAISLLIGLLVLMGAIITLQNIYRILTGT